MSLEALEARLRTILPAAYQDCYEDVRPVSMGSAGLKFDGDGKVAWGEIWGSFCDLAMAGGPPHKGTLLEPGSAEEIAAAPERYAEAAAEICRGIGLATELDAAPGPEAGWVRVACESEAMADWLRRAIVMENIAARRDGAWLELPAGPAYRLEKEIKNVITSIAKTSHYWLEHMWSSQHREIAALFAQMEAEMPLAEPAGGDRAGLAELVQRETGLQMSGHAYADWLGFQCPDARSAIWMMRALVVSNVLARREGTTLFVPVAAEVEAVARRVAEAHGFAVARGVI